MQVRTKNEHLCVLVMAGMMMFKGRGHLSWGDGGYIQSRSRNFGRLFVWRLLSLWLQLWDAS